MLFVLKRGSLNELDDDTERVVREFATAHDNGRLHLVVERMRLTDVAVSDERLRRRLETLIDGWTTDRSFADGARVRVEIVAGDAPPTWDGQEARCWRWEVGVGFLARGKFEPTASELYGENIDDAKALDALARAALASGVAGVPKRLNNKLRHGGGSGTAAMLAHLVDATPLVVALAVLDSDAVAHDVDLDHSSTAAAAIRAVEGPSGASGAVPPALRAGAWAHRNFVSATALFAHELENLLLWVANSERHESPEVGAARALLEALFADPDPDVERLALFVNLMPGNKKNLPPSDVRGSAAWAKLPTAIAPRDARMVIAKKVGGAFVDDVAAGGGRANEVAKAAWTETHLAARTLRELITMVAWYCAAAPPSTGSPKGRLRSAEA